MTKTFPFIVLVALFAVLGGLTPTWAADDADADKPGKTAANAADAKDAPIPDLARETVDPYVPGKERARFMAAAGVDSELDEKEFEANAEAKDPFVRVFDKWSLLTRFDKNRDKKIDWFEADAYRRDLRKRMLGVYDKNVDTRLKGPEREAANKALATGKLPKPTPLAQAGNNNGPNNVNPNDRPRRGSERRAEFIKRWDKDGDGELSREERREMGVTMIQEGRNRQVAKWDDNNDGILDENERARVMDDRRDKWWLMLDDIGMKHFDADGDQKLSEQESRDIVAFGEQLESLGKKWEKRFLDEDGDGEISTQERRTFESRMQMVGISMLPEAIKWADTDGDGVPSRQELEAVALRAAEAGKRELDTWVKRYDNNGDGRLDSKERAALVNGIDEDVAARVKRNDKDGDGKLSNGEIRTMVIELAEQFGVKPKE